MSSVSQLFSFGLPKNLYLLFMKEKERQERAARAKLAAMGGAASGSPLSASTVSLQPSSPSAAVQMRTVVYTCRWEGCHARFDVMDSLSDHVLREHITFGAVQCRWGACRMVLSSRQQLTVHFAELHLPSSRAEISLPMSPASTGVRGMSATPLSAGAKYAPGAPFGSPITSGAGQMRPTVGYSSSAGSQTPYGMRPHLPMSPQQAHGMSMGPQRMPLNGSVTVGGIPGAVSGARPVAVHGRLEKTQPGKAFLSRAYVRHIARTLFDGGEDDENMQEEASESGNAEEYPAKAESPKAERNKMPDIQRQASEEAAERTETAMDVNGEGEGVRGELKAKDEEVAVRGLHMLERMLRTDTAALEALLGLCAQ